MPRGGHNKKHASPTVGPAALAKWPPAPKHFTAADGNSWRRIGEAVMSAGSASPGDLVLAERLAQLHSRVSAALADPEAQMTALSAMMRLEADLLNRMGLTPQARNTIGPLSKPKPKTALDEF